VRVGIGEQREDPLDGGVDDPGGLEVLGFTHSLDATVDTPVLHIVRRPHPVRSQCSHRLAGANHCAPRGVGVVLMARPSRHARRGSVAAPLHLGRNRRAR
jgi:hypothetical protein